MSILSKIRRQLLPKDVNIEIDLIRNQYYLKLKREKVPVLVVSCLDSRVVSSGFADRIRGMISCYAYAKANDIPFRIEHIAPFDLSDFLVPNHYDWMLREGEKSYNLLYANPVVFLQHTVSQRSMKLFRIRKNRQHHLYTNAEYIKEINSLFNRSYQFTELYQELFKPSERLKNILAIPKEELTSSGGYISVSFRFMQLMGDFKDSHGITLSEGDRTDLLRRSLSIIENLFDQYHKRVLVTSDSQTFLNEARQLDYVYVAPGKVGHIGHSQDNAIVEKMLVDFLLISQADHVFMAHSGEMYRSNFARTAALSSGAPYDEISY